MSTDFKQMITLLIQETKNGTEHGVQRYPLSPVCRGARGAAGRWNPDRAQPSCWPPTHACNYGFSL